MPSSQGMYFLFLWEAEAELPKHRTLLILVLTTTMRECMQVLSREFGAVPWMSSRSIIARV